MSYRSLLVHIDADPLCRVRSAQAIALARQLDCHLVGLAPTGLLNLPVLPASGATLDELGSLAWGLLESQAQQAAADFRAHCEQAGLRSYEAPVDSADTAQSLIRHAHCSDLCLLSQPDPSSASHRLSSAVVEQVLLHSARPTLLLPYVQRAASARMGGRVLVAWDDGREAARALSDALPLLRQAEQVQVVHWQRPDSMAAPRLEALQQWLLWQGVSAETHSEATTIEVPEALLSRAADQGCDLIVMGAYGHSRLAEWVLGGATRGLLAAMTVPLLMSH